MKGSNEAVPLIIIGSLLFIILGLIMFILTGDIPVNPLHESLLSFVGTLGGAFIGAWLAGKYAVNAAKITIDANKLMEYEDLRRSLIRNMPEFASIKEHAKYLTIEDLKSRDIELATKNIINSMHRIEEFLNVETAPSDYLDETQRILIEVRNLEFLAKMRARGIKRNPYYSEKEVLGGINRLDVQLKKLLRGLKINI